MNDAIKQANAGLEARINRYLERIRLLTTGPTNGSQMRQAEGIQDRVYELRAAQAIMLGAVLSEPVLPAQRNEG